MSRELFRGPSNRKYQSGHVFIVGSIFVLVLLALLFVNYSYREALLRLHGENRELEHKVDIIELRLKILEKATGNEK